jgi:hypothetical protein
VPAPLLYVGYPLTMGDVDHVFAWVDLAKHGGSGFRQVLAFGPRDASYYVEPLTSSSVPDEATVREGAAGAWRLSRGLLFDRPLATTPIPRANSQPKRRSLGPHGPGSARSLRRDSETDGDRG